jgi:hypothetical protein
MMFGFAEVRVLSSECPQLAACAGRPVMPFGLVLHLRLDGDMCDHRQTVSAFRERLV